MRRISQWIAGLAALGLGACTPGGGVATGGDAPPATRMVAPILDTPDAVDTASFAQPLVARVTHVTLDLNLDFHAKRVAGTARLQIAARDDARTIILDSNGLEISRVTDADGNALPFTIGAHVEDKGEPVTVTMGAARQIIIHYASAPDADALQWLTPEQTAGGRHPYLLSQGQAILNRSWVPTQDSPGIRQTWNARITAPQPLTVVMSGIRDCEPQASADGASRTFCYRMDHPVAPYLIAIAAGDIAFRPLGPRTGVWTEPAMMDAAVAELADTERMVEAAEALYGPYRWGRYDVIVLPPSFPFGGMENPTLTFLTPTFIAGDRSLNGLVAHELAHSWSGNLVTNATWGDGWLNEGVTSYFENRIVEALYGTRRARQEEALSFADADAAMAEYGADADITRLRLPPGEDGPDGGAGGIVYDKGATFLRTVERIVGRDRFDVWLRSWFDRHAFQPATSAMFLADMRANLVRGDMALEARLMLDQWVYGTGWPANVARPDPAAFAEVDRSADAYRENGGIPRDAWTGWTTAERLRFLSRVERQRTAPQLAALDTALGLSRSGNNEILFAWLNLALANRYDPAVPVADRFLRQVGRRKFVVPLYRTLMASDWGQPLARRLYAETRPGYHAVTRSGVDAIMTAAR